MEASIAFKKVGHLIDGKTVLAGLSFGIERNSTVAIIGDNDDGSITSFLRITAGYDNPDYGSIFVHGLDNIKDRKEIRKLIGYVPLENDMDPWLTAEQNIKYINNLYKIDKNETAKLYHKYVHALDLKDKLNIEVNKLSQGTLRKLTLLRELSRNPQILILDHPTELMNSKDRALTMDLIQSLNHKMTIIYSSSSFNMIESFHDRILVFHDGILDLDDNFNNMLKNWMGKYNIVLHFEDFPTSLFEAIKEVKGIISPFIEEHKLIFNANSRSVLLRVMSLLSGVTITDINIKRFHLKDLLAARYQSEEIV